MIRKARSNVRFIYRTKAFSLKLVLKGAIKRKFIPETSANFNRLLETSLSQREIRIFRPKARLGFSLSSIILSW